MNNPLITHTQKQLDLIVEMQIFYEHCRLSLEVLDMQKGVTHFLTVEEWTGYNRALQEVSKVIIEKK